ncbi:heavy-metal-associated domain-containing protein [uncultured Clostridium sp.]|uniref:heavy-metal-associated domain-containing protein n=1 Tax=uncultured Clostridium sp. TaxID=59620 RepID=UPI0025F4FE48|nr:cation transporter [uncultured Clostridium sp.]
MIKTILGIDGMMCGMCENHMNDLIRKTFKVEKVTSSHKKGETEILSEESLDEEKLKSAVESIGYKVLSVKEENYEKKRFSFFKK